jgi:hypothetical protein
MKGRHEGSRKGWQAEPARNPAAPHTAPPVATRPTLHPTTTPVKTNHFLSHNHAVTTPECVANFLHRLLLGQPARINQMSRRPEPASSPIWVIRQEQRTSIPCQVFQNRTTASQLTHQPRVKKFSALARCRTDTHVQNLRISRGKTPLPPAPHGTRAKWGLPLSCCQVRGCAGARCRVRAVPSSRLAKLKACELDAQPSAGRVACELPYVASGARPAGVVGTPAGHPEGRSADPPRGAASVVARRLEPGQTSARSARKCTYGKMAADGPCTPSA